MTIVLSSQSLSKLQGVHPKLVEVLKKAAEEATQGFMVLQGVRSNRDCFINFGKGRDAAECLAGGCPAEFAAPHMGKVTWLNHALGSKHCIQSDGYGHAVDVAPEPLNWDDLAGFVALTDRIRAVGHRLGIELRWGGDWNQNGIAHEKGETDNPHLELV